MSDSSVQLRQLGQQLLASLFDSTTAGQLVVACAQQLLQRLAQRLCPSARRASPFGQSRQARLQHRMKAQRAFDRCGGCIQAAPQAGAVIGQTIQSGQTRFQRAARLQAAVLLLQQRAALAVGDQGVRHLQATAFGQRLALALKRQGGAQQFDIGIVAAPQPVAGSSQRRTQRQLLVNVVQRLQALCLARPALAAAALGYRHQRRQGIRPVKTRSL